MFESVLVANRGEIARRVVRTLKRLGIRSIAVYSDADRAAPFVREADDAVRLGPAAPAESYLSIERVLDAAGRAGAEAIHPGYGFLSENPDFSRACGAAGIVFVGPSPEAMEAMADKQRAKEIASNSGVPVVPAVDLESPDRDDFPILIKAAAGGGGRGMRVVERRDDLSAAVEAARREALAGFGDERVFAERFLPRARHLEVQAIADSHGNVLHLGERECSLQRRHQKIVEEAPSPAVSPELRERLGAEAVALLTRVGYENAGTVEFVAEADDPDTHYFLEVNARLQVEHPVTEAACGLDLVELQLRVAAGEPLPLEQADVELNGHAIEARVNAEDADRDFLPASGTILGYREPSLAGIRVDGAIERRMRIGTEYDSLLCKVIAHASSREAAIARLDRALAGTAILGVATTTGYLRRLLASEEVRAGNLDTGLVGRLELPPPDIDERIVAAAAALIQTAVNRERAGDDPFAATDGWRLGGQPAWSHWRIAVNGGGAVEVRVRGRANSPEFDVGDGPVPAEVRRIASQAFAITIAGVRRTWDYAYEGNIIWLGREGHVWRTRRASSEAASQASVHGDLRAPMPGQVLSVVAQRGSSVLAGDPILVLESMKMELTIAAPVPGTVETIAVQAGDQVVLDQPLARIAPEEDTPARTLGETAALPAEDEAAWPLP